MAVVCTAKTAIFQKSANFAKKAINLEMIAKLQNSQIRKFFKIHRKFAFLRGKNERNVKPKFYAKRLFGGNFG